jgi:hypothetical protein
MVKRANARGGGALHRDREIRLVPGIDRNRDDSFFYAVEC